MPATFDAFGLRFLYPENWLLVHRDESEGQAGATFELPGGGFVSLETISITRSDEVVLDEVNVLLREQYDEVEQESVNLDYLTADDRCVDFRFIYLDLVVVSRMILVDAPWPTRDFAADPGRLMLQFQAEMRDFEANERVLEAILKQIQDSQRP